eukprot:GHVU01012132.1.p1 GENE.GHVU01012132.1~~GHVU01012132.1.p1  ORF type:complete len:256 (+),score=23.34 GHVU01012132.1:1557-2324(+)
MMESPVSADIGKLPLKEKVRLCFRPQTFFDGSDEEGNLRGRRSSSGVFGHRVSAASREEDVAIAATDAVVEEVHRICERRKGGAEIEREGGEVTSAEEDRRPEPWDDSHPVLAAADDDVDDAQAVAAAGATRNTATKDVPLYLLPFLMELLREGLSSDDSQVGGGRTRTSSLVVLGHSLKLSPLLCHASRLSLGPLCCRCCLCSCFLRYSGRFRGCCRRYCRNGVARRPSFQSASRGAALPRTSKSSTWRGWSCI